MVARDQNRDRALRGSLEGFDETAEMLIDLGDFTEVWVLRVPAAEGFGRGVGRMRVEVVNPQETRLLGRALEKRDGSIGGLSCRALGLLDIVVDVEAPSKTKTTGQNEGRNKGRGFVSSTLKTLGEKGMCGVQGPRVLVDAMTRGIQARHHRGVRRERLGHGRVGAGEEPASGREGVERRCLNPAGRGSDRVGSRGVEGHEKNRRSNEGRARTRASRLFVACAAGRKNRQRHRQTRCLPGVSSSGHAGSTIEEHRSHAANPSG